MNNAAPGQQVRVKTADGQIITGIVKDSQTVEIRALKAAHEPVSAHVAFVAIGCKCAESPAG